MIETFELIAESRSDTGKGASRRLRRTGMVPGIVYGGHKDPEPIALGHNTLLRHLEHEAFYSHVLTVKVGDVESKVVLKDLQRHPAKPFVMHADFQRVSADEKLRMMVPLHFINEASSLGVKAGGQVSHNLTEVEVACLPRDLPEFIAVDIADMDLGDILHLSEMPLPEGVTLAHAPDPDVPVVIIHAGHIGGEETAEGGEAQPA
jgi:large subunit ribosomal protein L25